MALINHGFTSDEAQQLAAASALGLVLSRARLWTARLRLRRRYDERQQLACVRAGLRAGLGVFACLHCLLPACQYPLQTCKSARPNYHPVAYRIINFIRQQT